MSHVPEIVLEEFLDGLPPLDQKIVRAVRKVVRATIPEAEETVLWGGLSYHRPWIGGRVKGAVCQITAKRGQVRLEFIHGIRLCDPQRLLQGNGLSKRHLVIATPNAADRPEIAKWIHEAAGLDPTLWVESD